MAAAARFRSPLPEYVMANVLSMLPPLDMLACECVARQFVTRAHTVEAASWAAVMRRAARRASSVRRRHAERWWLLLVLLGRLRDATTAAAADDDDDDDDDLASWLLFGGGAAAASFNAARLARAVSCYNAAIRHWLIVVPEQPRQFLTRQPLAAAALLPRQADAARRLGASGHWEQASELLLCALDVMETLGKRREEEGGDDDDDVAAMLARAATEVAISTLLVDRLYAGTYVVVGEDRDSRDLALAITLSRNAVSTLRQLPEEEESLLPSDGGEGKEEGRQAATVGRLLNSNGAAPPAISEAEFIPRGTRLALALVSLGRALALGGQHVALGAMGERWRRRLESAPVIFRQGERALAEAIAIGEATAEGGEVLVAEARAALGELFYCAASGNSRCRFTTGGLSRAALLEEGEDPTESVLRLATASIDMTLDSISKHAALGRGETSAHSQMMKDVGKVYGFRTDFATSGAAGDAESARLWLQRAVDLQSRLNGREHRSVKNCRRLLGDAEDDDHGGDDEAAATAEVDSERARADLRAALTAPTTTASSACSQS